MVLHLDRCPRYPQVPSYCILAQDPNDPCCKVPVCNTASPTPQPNGAPTTGPTPPVGSTFPPTLMPPVTPGPIPTPPPQPKSEHEVELN